MKQETTFDLYTPTCSQWKVRFMSVIALMHSARRLSSAPKNMTASAKLTLFALANRHNQETGRCDPSVETLSLDVGLSERAVRAGIRALEKARFITTTHRNIRTGAGRRNLTNRYRILGVRGGAGFAGGMGQDLPTNQTNRPSAFDDLAMLIEGGDQ